MKKTSIILAFALCFSLFSCEKEKTKYTEYYFDYFDTVTTIVGYEYTKEEFDSIAGQIEERLKYYHELFDIYNTYKGINNLATVNENALSAVTVKSEIIELLEFSVELYNATNGKTNIALGSVTQIWHSIREADEKQLPSEDVLFEAASHAKIEYISIDRETCSVQINDGKTRIDVGATAKGFAIEKIAKWLEDEGKSGYVLNVGGNVRLIGNKKANEKWSIAIENPDTSNSNRPYIAILSLNSGSVTTSGAYQRYFELDSKRYGHIIDSETLYPADKFLSVSVYSESAAIGDALSTALFQMDIDWGMKLIEGFDNTYALWVKKDGSIEYSNGFEKYIDLASN